jgi:hypothetical protein
LRVQPLMTMRPLLRAALPVLVATTAAACSHGFGALPGVAPGGVTATRAAPVRLVGGTRAQRAALAPALQHLSAPGVVAVRLTRSPGAGWQLAVVSGRPISSPRAGWRDVAANWAAQILLARYAAVGGLPPIRMYDVAWRVGRHVKLDFGGNVRRIHVEAPRGPGVRWIGIVRRAAVGTGLHFVSGGEVAVGRGAFVTVTLRTRTPARVRRQISAMFARVPIGADVSVPGHQTIVTGPCGRPIAIFQRAPHGGAGWVDPAWICPDPWVVGFLGRTVCPRHPSTVCG